MNLKFSTTRVFPDQEGGPMRTDPIQPATAGPVAVRQQRSWLSPLRAAWVLLAASGPAMAAFDSGSTGADGALNPSSNIEIVLPPSGVLNYTSVNIPVGVTVTFRRNALNTPVVMLASGNVVVAGTVDVRGSTAPDAGTLRGGSVADDGQAGRGGPGGYDGGAGGAPWVAPNGAGSAGGYGRGPGGGIGGLGGVDRVQSWGCYDGRQGYYRPFGLGAAYANVGANPNLQNNCGTPVAQPYGAAALQPMIGGSGGGGGGGRVYSGAGGGGGGGAILIASTGTLSITGTLTADAGNGGNTGNHDLSGGGAGGSGGAIRLVATSVTGSGNIYARGGCNRDSCDQYVWKGSVGRIRIEGETITFNGTSSPTASRDVPAPLVIANAPALRISAIGGVAVPEVPTGVADVKFDTAPANPVRVDFVTSNIPPGNTVLLRVVPESGALVQALSPAIAGTTANGTASVSLNLPTGASTLQAIASFTVAVAMGDALSNYAYGERVERVEITATLGGPSLATLITVSGKRAQVPVELLRLYGALG